MRPDDPEQMLYYLARAVTNDPWRPMQVLLPGTAATEALRLGRTSLAVITAPLDDELANAVKQYMAQGGTALVVPTSPALVAVAADLSGAALPEATQAKADDYAMWSDIDFDNRLFRPFASPQFSDFSSIHFWTYQKVPLPDPADSDNVSDAEDTSENKNVSASQNAWNPVVRYDNGDLALVEASVGKGWLYLLTTSWRPDDSQLARSSKFVPLLMRLMGTDTLVHSAGYRIDDPIPCPRPLQDSQVTVRKPDGTLVPLTTDQVTFDQSDQPGIYQLLCDGNTQPVAINVARASHKLRRLTRLS